MRKKVFITGGLIALFLLLSSSTAFAQSLKLSSEEIALIKTEINSGIPVRDVLKAHHIGMNQIRAALGSTEMGKHRAKLSNTQISTIATKLGLDPVTILNEIDSGKTFQEILKAHNITKEMIKTALGDEIKPAHAKKLNKKHR